MGAMGRGDDDAYTNPDAHPNTYANADSYTNANPDAYAGMRIVCRGHSLQSWRYCQQCRRRVLMHGCRLVFFWQFSL